jgi:hypothetical protein
MGFILPWIAELAVGALPLILFYLVEGLKKPEAATLTCNCNDPEGNPQTCLAKVALHLNHTSVLTGSVPLSVPVRNESSCSAVFKWSVET